jgi:hypothetical protein
VKTPKKAALKYFEPVEIGNILRDELSGENLGIDSGYFSRTPQKKRRFLNSYTVSDMLAIVDRVGLSEHLRARGFARPIIELNVDDEQIHYFRLYDGDTTPENILIDLRITESRFLPDKRFFEDGRDLSTLDMVVIEWLSMQDPRGGFSSDRPQLPGQMKPGLGALRYMIKMMYIVAEGVTKDGFLDVPDHMHGAVMYSKNFKFFDPAHEAVLRAILRDLRKYSLTDLSWGMITNTVIDTSTGKPQVYDPSEQIFPVSKRLRDYFKSKLYVKRFDEVYKKKKYRLDYERMVSMRRDLLLRKKTEEL